MGFIVMVVSAVLGILLLVAGIKKTKENKAWICATVIGILLIIGAIVLALPH